MNMHGKTLGKQEGSVTLVVVIVLALLTVIGISASNMSTTELEIAGNDKDYKIAFYHTESGPYSVAKFVGRSLDENEVPKLTEELLPEEVGEHRFEYLDATSSDLLDEIFGYDNAYDDAKDIRFSMTSGLSDDEVLTESMTSLVSVNLDRKTQRQAVGGGVEYGVGASGIGEKTAVEIPFWLYSDGEAGNGAKASISCKYIKRYGVPGGL